MTISYNWLSEYLPEKIEPERLSKILTSIGLEVESLEQYESIKGALNGLIIGEVMECVPHPNADKLKLTKVNTGAKELLQIVCGAPNVATGQKVITATAGTTIYPLHGGPLTMKVAKIRGMESQGMICAEDEIGIGENHDGIIVLSDDAKVGSPAAAYYNVYADWVYEIGLTPNHMDAMSHLGVAKDVCAYLTQHENKILKAKSPFTNSFKTGASKATVKVSVENTDACQRYSGLCIKGVTIKESPQWLQHKLKAIGQKPINNIVDITNFILHETGQPLHAFDADEIKGNRIIVRNLPEGTAFTTLDGKERKLNSEDLMICDAESGICIAGVFGGLNSGVKDTTQDIFLESAWFHPVSVRKTETRHGLKTEAASHFEKGVDISNTVNVLKHAAVMIKEIAGGETEGDVVDIYPQPKEKTEVAIKYHYLKKLSGKNYHPDAVKKILTSLGFEIIKEGLDELRVAVPYNKPDIFLPADLVEEVIRIDGIDNIDIPTSITISPSSDETLPKEKLKEKISNYLVGAGFNEILTNSITSSKYYSETELKSTVRMINNLSAGLDVLRPSMLETAFESIAYNINRKNNNLQFFEFGKTYACIKTGQYKEQEHFCIYLTGHDNEDGWRQKSSSQDYFKTKGLARAVLSFCGFSEINTGAPSISEKGVQYEINCLRRQVGVMGNVSAERLQKFDIRQPVYFIDLYFEDLLQLALSHKIIYSEVPKFPAVQRDLAFTVNKNVAYNDIETAMKEINLPMLQGMRLFDVFESSKIGEGKKSMAVNFTFMDEEKTLTDKEIDNMMQKITLNFEKKLDAEIRK